MSAVHITFENFVNLKHIIHYITTISYIYIYIYIYTHETYLDSSVTHNNENIQLDGYSLIRSDYPSDTKRGGVCLYYKESLGFKNINLSVHNKCIICEVFIENFKRFTAAIYRSPSQNNDQFETFLFSFEKLHFQTLCFI